MDDQSLPEFDGLSVLIGVFGVRPLQVTGPWQLDQDPHLEGKYRWDHRQTYRQGKDLYSTPESREG